MPETETILVTGGAGFVGSNLCHFLIEKEFQVICLDNFDDFYSEEIKQNNVIDLQNNPSFKLIKGDIRDSVLLDSVFSKHKIDFVIHLAAKAGVRNSISNPKEYFDVNVNGSICLLETMKKHNVKNLVFSSSSSVYGNKNGKMVETEICDNPISPYAVSKRSVELLNYNYHINSNFNVVNLRLFSVYGKNQRPDLVLYKFLSQILKNEPIEIYGNADTTRDYTYIDDVVNALFSSVELLKNKKKEIYEIINVGNNNPISLRQLIGFIKTATNKQDIEIIESDFVKGEVNNTHSDNDKAKKILIYNPKTSVENGVFLFYEWYRNIKPRILKAHLKATPANAKLKLLKELAKPTQKKNKT